MREIGSEFWDVPAIETRNNIVPEFTQWFLSGRSALYSILKGIKGCHTVAMPSWCCASMVKPFVDAGISVSFYPVYWNKGLVQEIRSDTDILFLMDYFGYTSEKQRPDGFKGIVIRDITHSVFSKAYDDADYYFGSFRKWCGVWTGGFGWSRDGHALYSENGNDYGYTMLRSRAMQLKNNYIHDRGIVDKEYLDIFDKAEEILEKTGILPSAERDIYMIRHMDVDFLKKRRRENADILRAAFSDFLMFSDMNERDCPMFVPILVPENKRNLLRRHLINNSIYCPVHWPLSGYHRLDDTDINICNNELSLVCDQRYTEKDMKRMVDIITIFLKEV